MSRRLTTAAGPPPKNGLPPAHTYKGWEERRQGRFRRKVRPQGPTTWSLSPPATQLAAPQPPAASPSPCPESIMSRLRRDAAAHAVKVRVSSQSDANQAASVTKTEGAPDVKPADAKPTSKAAAPAATT